MDDTKLVIIGAKGQLGQALQAQYPNAQAVDSDKLDITDQSVVDDFDWINISTILNAAAYTNVDGAETPEGRVAAWKVNATGVANLARAAIKHNLTLVHLSTEYVFDGTNNNHSEDEPPSPLSVYGSTKAAGDIVASLAPKHYICRTTSLVGEGKNFVRTMIGLGQKGIAPKVVADQIGRLTFTPELVRIVDHLLTKNAPFGTYNTTNGGEPASWADITRAVFVAGNFDLQVTDTTTAEYFADKPEAAKRPLLSVLNLSKLEKIGLTPRDWRENLQEYVQKEISNT
jgi:dTDP-4-dehydrorhamnose 3,5-epimerase/reductase